jgi:DNA-binding Lrp family transcriptional regulator
LDDIDKKMISILQGDGRKSLSDIGKELKMSHVAVSKRLDKLVKKEKLLKISAGVNSDSLAGVNSDSLDMKVFFMALETESMDVAERIQEEYKSCPRLVMFAPVTGRYNIFAIMVAEDTWSLESVIGTCSMRTEPGVRRSESWFGNAPTYPKYLELNLAPENTGTATATCGRNCGTCKRYISEKCLGCPSTSLYKGKLWASPIKGKKRRKSKS